MIPEFGLKGVVLGLGIRIWWIDKYCWIMLLIVFFWVVFDDMLCIEPVNFIMTHLGWLGDQNWVFGWKRGLRIVGFGLCRW